METRNGMRPVHPGEILRARIAAAEGPSPESLGEMLPSGRQSLFDNRVARLAFPCRASSAHLPGAAL